MTGRDLRYITDAGWTGPAPFAVFQRDASGHADVRITASLTDTMVEQLRIVARIQSVSGMPMPGFPLTIQLPVVADSEQRTCEATFKLPAGGWYYLEAAVLWEGGKTAHTFGPFGVGEMFLIAGQSYMGGYHDEMTCTADEQLRITMYDPYLPGWRPVQDPLPDWPQRPGGTGLESWVSRHSTMNAKVPTIGMGSIWPQAMDTLQALLGVPVGIASVVRSNTQLADWAGGSDNYRALLQAHQGIGALRAILWGGGEKDARLGTTSDAFEAGMRTLIDSHAADVGTAVPWLVARSTLHPADYQDVDAQTAIRSAVDRLVASHPNVFPGPDTDLIGLEHRRVATHSRHYTKRGQVAAAMLWCNAVHGFVVGQMAVNSLPDDQRAAE